MSHKTKIPRLSKRSRAARTAFVHALVETVERVGAAGAFTSVDPELFDGPVWEGTLATIVGELRIAIYPNGIDLNATAYCRFVDVDRASGWFGMGVHNLNRFSGKWNHHYFGAWTAEHAAVDLECQLAKVIVPPQPDEPALVEGQVS